VRIVVDIGQGLKNGMNVEPKGDSKPKTAYQPPRVLRVSLRPEEAVLGHCKVAGITGPVSGSCRTFHCKTFGS
jgi:hypothetical protein